MPDKPVHDKDQTDTTDLIIWLLAETSKAKGYACSAFLSDKGDASFSKALKGGGEAPGGAAANVYRGGDDDLLSWHPSL